MENKITLPNAQLLLKMLQKFIKIAKLFLKPLMSGRELNKLQIKVIKNSNLKARNKIIKKLKKNETEYEKSIKINRLIIIYIIYINIDQIKFYTKLKI